MNRHLIFSLLILSTISLNAYFIGPKETKSQAAIRILKAAAIGGSVGTINGHYQDKVTFGNGFLFAGTFGAGHASNYALNGEKEPTLVELWAYGLAQMAGEYGAATTGNIGNPTLQQPIWGNVTLAWAAWKTFWYAIDKK